MNTAKYSKKFKILSYRNNNFEWVSIHCDNEKEAIELVKLSPVKQKLVIGE